MTTRRALAACALALGLAGHPPGEGGAAEKGPAPAEASSEEGAPAGAGRPGAAGAEPPTMHGELALSLQDAIAMGVENNLQVAIERPTSRIAEQELEAAWGAYDPELFSELEYQSLETPNASIFNPGTDVIFTRNINAEAGLRGLLPRLGLEYEIGYDLENRETSSQTEGLSPRTRTTLGVSGRLPLLQGLWWGEARVLVEQRKIGTETARQEFRQELMDAVRRIEEAYWRAGAAEEQLRVAEKSLETAEALLEQTEAQYEVGVVSRVEVVEARAGVAEREVGVIDAENDYRGAQDALIDEVLGPNLTATSRLEIRPTDRPEDFVEYPVDAERVTERAFENRPEFALARREIEQREIQLKGAENARLPELDVVGSYGFEGLSGKENPNALALGGVPPGSLPFDSGFEQADDDFFSAQGERNATIGLQFSIPLGNRGARADVDIAELELRRSRVRARRAEQQIVLDVREAIRNLRSSREGIGAAERRLAAAEEQLRAESIRLEHGESTPFDVLQRERDRAEAEGQRIEALRDYHTSVTALDRAQGTLLRDRGVHLEEAARLR